MEGKGSEGENERYAGLQNNFEENGSKSDTGYKTISKTKQTKKTD